MAEEFNIIKHSLVPEHVKLTDEEKNELLENFNIELNQLPMILLSDSAIDELKPEIGDVIKIIRSSPTNIKQEFYRVVVHG
jgi:DNA-directed RNA polymerase subunit H (RpoH/RPB5)